MAIQRPERELSDIPQAPTPVDDDTVTQDFHAEPLWKVRFRLFRKGLKRNWGLFKENKVGVLGLAIIGLFAAAAIAHPIMMRTVWSGQEDIYDPIVGYDAVMTERVIVEQVTDPDTEIDIGRARVFDLSLGLGDTVEFPRQPAPPSSDHLLGTDPLGRDVLSQLMFSTRAAFFLGAIAAIVTVVVATTVGSLAAYFGGWLDTLLMRQADLVLLMPLIPLLIVMSGLWTINLPLLGILIGILSGFGGTAIILKSQALQVTVKPFTDAARVAGGGNWFIIFRHIIPNVLPLSFLYMMFTVTEAITLEATLSFLGLLNVDMSWGLMIQLAHTGGFTLAGFEFWWLLIPAGLAVTMLAAAFFLVGRGMDEVINPRLRAR